MSAWKCPAIQKRSRTFCSNMFHGGKIAMLGIMPGSAAIDWNLVVFHGLTIKGIYGREMYETWYKMTAMIQSGLDISPVITHRFPYTGIQRSHRADEVRELRQDRPRGWTRTPESCTADYADSASCG